MMFGKVKNHLGEEELCIVEEQTTSYKTKIIKYVQGLGFPIPAEVVLKLGLKKEDIPKADIKKLKDEGMLLMKEQIEKDDLKKGDEVKITLTK